jgi:hypothetical protein
LSELLLEQWSLVGEPADPYKAPEQIVARLLGTVADNTIPDGQRTVVKTAAVTSAEGRKITTCNGEVYVLGRPCADYAAWVKCTQGKEIDERQPIKLV